MTSKKETFENLLRSFEYRYDLRTVFDDFLTMTMCAFSQNPLTGKSHDEDMYMEAIAKYAKDELRHNFPKMLGALTEEMEDRLGSGTGNDVLGEFYEQNLYRKGASQYFTPWPVCEMLASCLVGDAEQSKMPKRVLDPTCGSGRTLLAGAKHFGKHNNFYGIDIDHTCVKMAAINLFLNGMFNSEVMWADSLAPDCFFMSYRISFLPFGIFRITEKDNSLLWKLHRNSFKRNQPQPPTQSELTERPPNASPTNGAQLTLF